MGGRLEHRGALGRIGEQVRRGEIGVARLAGRVQPHGPLGGKRQEAASTVEVVALAVVGRDRRQRLLAARGPPATRRCADAAPCAERSAGSGRRLRGRAGGASRTADRRRHPRAARSGRRAPAPRARRRGRRPARSPPASACRTRCRSRRPPGAWCSPPVAARRCAPGAARGRSPAADGRDRSPAPSRTSSSRKNGLPPDRCRSSAVRSSSTARPRASAPTSWRASVSRKPIEVHLLVRAACRPGIGPAGPIQREHGDREIGDQCEQLVEDLEAGRIGPVQVVEHDELRTFPRPRSKHGRQRLHDQPLARLGGHIGQEGAVGRHRPRRPGRRARRSSRRACRRGPRPRVARRASPTVVPGRRSSSSDTSGSTTWYGKELA